MSMTLLTTAVYHETYKNMNPSNTCRRGRSSVPAKSLLSKKKKAIQMEKIVDL
jgi:hypothetical protein